MSTDLLYTVVIPLPAGRHVCVPELLERVRFEFDIASTSPRLTDAQILRVLNRSRDKLFQLLVNLDESWFRVTATIATTAASPIVTLPERLYAIERIAYFDTDGKERDLPRGTRRDALLGPSSEAWEQRRPVYYQTPTELVLSPTPAAARSLMLVYLQSWVDLQLPPLEPSCWDIQPTWDDWVIADTLVVLSRRSRRTEDVGVFTASRDELTVRYRDALRADSFEGPVFARRVMFADDECES